MIEILAMVSFIAHLVGLVVCLIGLTTARNPERRKLGYSLAVLGFLIAALPMLLQMFGVITPTPASPPR
ncbi:MULTISPECIES: hypothetical protein [Halomonadaceae]|uniref:hypothetical protein n=1 Tax=Halomonadaceae TaxID=28256 RepID=UPI0015991C5C|nr:MULTISPECIES: hypothetical protein [Halomonas]QJQ95767.1 hypothetical protein HIO72_11140 [Halomonas sp. PA5]